MTTNATIPQLDAAMALTNQKFGDNIIFNRIEAKGKRVHFTLRCKSSKGPGHRISYRYRKLIAACYHAHFCFIKNLFRVNPNCFIKSSMAQYNSLDDLKANCGYSASKNIGSRMQPMSYGDACECNY
jgi:hypothetical protein